MKKTYSNPKLSLSLFHTENILTTSGVSSNSLQNDMTTAGYNTKSISLSDLASKIVTK